MSECDTWIILKVNFDNKMDVILGSKNLDRNEVGSPHHIKFLEDNYIIW